MTPSQRDNFYIPKWRQCANANGWVMSNGRLICDAALNRFRSELHSQVWEIALNLAYATHRAVTPEDLRHACNFLAAKQTSSKKMNNRETNRVVTLFMLLANPDGPNNVKLMADWLNPHNADRVALIKQLFQYAPGYRLEAISGQVYGTRYWKELPDDKLRWLLGEVKRGSRRPHQKPSPTPYRINRDSQPVVKTVKAEDLWN